MRDVKDLERSFGSITDSIMSLFQAISGGDDWRNFVDQLNSGPSAVFNGANRFLFALYIAFATLVMLNLVTGVFVEGAQRLIRKENNGELTRIVRRLFTTSRMSGNSVDGKISWAEFQSHMESKCMVSFLKQLDVKFDDVERLFKFLDPERHGIVEVEEFVDGCIRLKSSPRLVDLNDLRSRIDGMHESCQSQLATIAANVQSLMDSLASPGF